MASKEELKNVVQGPRKGQLDKLNRLEVVKHANMHLNVYAVYS